MHILPPAPLDRSHCLSLSHSVSLAQTVVSIYLMHGQKVVENTLQLVLLHAPILWKTHMIMIFGCFYIFLTSDDFINSVTSGCILTMRQQQLHTGTNQYKRTQTQKIQRFIQAVWSIMRFSTQTHTFQIKPAVPRREKNNRGHKGKKRFLATSCMNVTRIMLISFSHCTFSMSCLRKSSMKALSEMISFWDGRGPSINKHTQTKE